MSRFLEIDLEIQGSIKVKVAFSKNVKDFQGWGSPKNFKGKFKLTLKNLEFQGNVKANIFNGGVNQGKGWML